MVNARLLTVTFQFHADPSPDFFAGIEPAFHGSATVDIKSF
jgi:hypothetical protein